jgi:hypothetical protein
MKSNFRRKNNITVVWAAILMSMGAWGVLSGCERFLSDKDDSEEQAREDSITVASTVRYGSPDVIITDKDGKPVPGPDGGALRASDIPTNPNMKFPIRDSIVSMAKTLGLPVPVDKGQILYGILAGDKQYYIPFNQFYPYYPEDKSMGDWGSLIESGWTCVIKEHSNGEIVDKTIRLGEWKDGKLAMLVVGDNTSVYINTPKRIEIYDYGSEKLIGYLEKSDKPNTYIRTTYEYQRTIEGYIIGDKPISTTVEEIPAGFIFVEQPEDDPNSVLGNQYEK